MKYLKSIHEGNTLWYNEFTRDINDILLEIKDIGYDVDLSSACPEFGSFYNSISIHNKVDPCYLSSSKEVKTPLDFDEIKDCVLRLKDYLGDKYHKCEVVSWVDYKWKGADTKGSYKATKFQLDEDSKGVTERGYKIYAMYIYYK